MSRPTQSSLTKALPTDGGTDKQMDQRTDRPTDNISSWDRTTSWLRGPPGPPGSEALPSGSEALPPGSEALLSGSEALPAGSEALPAGSEALPAGSDPLPAGDWKSRRSPCLKDFPRVLGSLS